MTQTAVVFGATGLVGKELVFELLGDSQFLKVITVGRRPLPMSNPKLEQLIVKNYDDLLNYTNQLIADVYFCCIGTTIKKAGTQEAFKKVDLDIPAKIASLAQALKVPVLVVISSVGANNKSSNFYLRTKGEMEQHILSTYKGNVKFMRPSLLLGHRSEFRLGERIAQIMAKITSFLMIGPLAKYRGIYSWDVARGMIKAMELPPDITVIESDEIQRLAGQMKTRIKDHEVIK